MSDKNEAGINGGICLEILEMILPLSLQALI